MRNRKGAVGLWWHFDRVFGDNRRWGWQVVFIVALVTVLVLLIALVGWLLTLVGCVKENAHDSMPLIQSIGLAFGTTNLPGGIEYDGNSGVFPLWWQAVAALLSAVVFSGVTITFVGNLLGNRQEAYRNGSVRYRFSDHVLFLGGGEMVAPMLKQMYGNPELYKDPELPKLHYVVLTERDAAEVRLALMGELSEEERRMKITVLRGRRDDADELRSVGCGRARRIYIVGDNPQDDGYDSVNMACWTEARKQNEGRTGVPCYLLLERASSEYIFRRNAEALPACFDTTIVNRLETVAQRVLVHNSERDDACPPLDRGGIGPESERTVHLVLYGMTAFSYAMATTAAHLCHFPNFVSVGEKDGRKVYGERLDRRTKITFIAPKIAEEMNYLTSHLSQLFALSKVTKEGVIERPEEDFLDIEWEFVDGNIAEPRVRELLEAYYQANERGETYLTLALCQREARRNIASALYLPDCFHRIVTDGEGRVDFEKTIPIFAYQSDSEVQLEMAHDEVPFYRNIFPVGSVRKSYDPDIRRRIDEGKRINYIYKKYNASHHAMPQKEKEFDEIWPEVYTKQKSNIYCANHIGVKLRSVGARVDELREDGDLTELMAVVEHNRWNIEELLMGYAPVAKEVHEELRVLAATGKKDELDARKQLLKKQFLHDCILPYEQLLEGDKVYDRLIARYLNDVMKKKTTE